MRTRVALLLAWLIVGPVASQQLELTPFVGYRAGTIAHDGTSEDNRLIEVDDGESWGLVLDVEVGRRFQIELLYEQMDTLLRHGRNHRELGLEYLHVGGLYYWRFTRIEPFLAASAGSTRFRVEAAEYRSRFSIAIGSGVKIFASDHLGFRFEHRLWISKVEEGDPLICSFPECEPRQGQETFVQVDLRAGLIVRF